MALAASFASPLHKDQTAAESFKWVWLYPMIPFLGSLAGVLFYEFFYKKARYVVQTNVNERADTDEDEPVFEEDDDEVKY